jgi:hypothetical protein
MKRLLLFLLLAGTIGCNLPRRVGIVLRNYYYYYFHPEIGHCEGEFFSGNTH